MVGPNGIPADLLGVLVENQQNPIVLPDPVAGITSGLVQHATLRQERERTLGCGIIDAYLALNKLAIDYWLANQPRRQPARRAEMNSGR